MGEPRDTIGRDHHIDAYTMWLAGGGIRPGIVYGETDELGFGVVREEIHVHDLQATILHCLGLDHEKFTFRHQGREFRLTDVHGRVVKEILAWRGATVGDTRRVSRMLPRATSATEPAGEPGRLADSDRG